MSNPIICPECKESNLEKKTKACPRCGYPILKMRKQRRNIWIFVFLLLLVLILWTYVIREIARMNSIPESSIITSISCGYTRIDDIKELLGDPDESKVITQQDERYIIFEYYSVAILDYNLPIKFIFHEDTSVLSSMSWYIWSDDLIDVKYWEKYLNKVYGKPIARMKDEDKKEKYGCDYRDTDMNYVKLYCELKKNKRYQTVFEYYE